MAEVPSPPTGLADFLADLRYISGRMARFEDIPVAELAAFHARKRELLGREPDERGPLG